MTAKRYRDQLEISGCAMRNDKNCLHNTEIDLADCRVGLAESDKPKRRSNGT